MYRLITFILLCANICIADIFAATVKECEVDSMYNDTLIIGKKVICGQKIYPQRDDVITACLAHERRLYLVGKLKDTLLVITDDPALFSNDAFCDVNFKHFKSPDYKCIKKKQGKTRYVYVVNKTDTLIFKKTDSKSNYSLQRGISMVFSYHAHLLIFQTALAPWRNFSASRSKSTMIKYPMSLYAPSKMTNAYGTQNMTFP